MSTTMAKVIASELAILIAILGWMAFSHLATQKPLGTPGAEQSTGSFAAISPVYKAPARTRALDLVDNSAAPIDYADAGQAMPDDGSRIAAEPAVDYGPDSYPAAPDPSNYIGTFPEPVLGPDYDYGYGYQQPTEIIVVANSRGFGQRCFAPGRMQRWRGNIMPGHRRPPFHNPRRSNAHPVLHTGNRFPGTIGGFRSPHAAQGIRPTRPFRGN